MRMIDFIYDGIRASEMGLSLCEFDWVSDNTVDVGNEIDPNPVKAIQSDRYWSIGPHYDTGKTPFETDLSVTRDPCTYQGRNPMDYVEYAFTDDEINKIMSWLNRKAYHRFEAIYNDDDYRSFDQIFYMATFNVDLVLVGSHCVGFKLHMMTNAPYAWGNRIQHQAIIDPEHPYECVSTSHDSGFIYMDAYITPLEDGDLEITNDFDPDYVVAIHNAKAGYVYHMPEHIKQIEVMNGNIHQWLYDDFNWNFIRLVNRFREHRNRFHSTIPISIDWRYLPIRKVGMIG